MTTDQEQLQSRVAALTALQNIARELMTELNLERLSHKILRAAIEVLNGSEGSLWIWVPTDELVVAVSEDPALVGYRMPADRGIAGWVFTHGEPLIVGDVTQDERFFQETDQYLGFRTHSIVAVPLMTPTEKLGVVQVLNKKSGEQFDEHDQATLSALAAQAAAMVVNARLYQEVEQEKNRMITLQDEMREKLARDLHDGPAQTLAAMMMNAEFIQLLCEREPERVSQELANLREAASRTLEQVRNAMFELRPVVLETEGLKAALEYYVERRNRTDGMNVHLDVRNLEGRLPSRVERLCFAIIHEAVGNVRKHANAEHAWVILERRQRDLVVAVRDDGEGFDVAEIGAGYERRGSLGLLNMRERSEVLGARYALESVPGEGTLVYLIVPLTDGDALGTEGAETADRADTLAGREGDRKRQTGPLGLVSTDRPLATRRRKGTGPLSLLGPNAGAERES